MVSLRTQRVGAPKAFLRYPSFHLKLVTSDSIEVSGEVAAGAKASALWASLHSKLAHRISGSPLKKNLACVNRKRSASSSPNSVSTQLREGHFWPLAG